MFFLLSGFSAVAEELWRLRYFVPTAAESQIQLGSSKATGKLNTSGHSVNLVFSNGIGLSVLRYNPDQSHLRKLNLHYVRMY
jgi:hypothetical protein